MSDCHIIKLEARDIVKMRTDGANAMGPPLRDHVIREGAGAVEEGWSVH